MKILEVCPFSAGICGVWARVKEESIMLSKEGNEVRIFSSDLIKSSGKIAQKREKIGGAEIYRFSNNQNFLHKKISKNVTYFDFSEEFIKYRPDRVITHLLHPHSFKALKLCRKYGVKCYIVPHAPFAVKRNFLLEIATKFYYNIKVKKKLREFDKVIAIAKWEIPHLLKLGVKKENISYVPNGIPGKFFTQKESKEENKILFLGRISPVKDLITLIHAMKKIKNKEVKLEIAGPYEEEYMKEIKREVKILNLDKRVTFSSAIYDIEDKINKIDSAKIFVLPSIREGMPQSLIEAMARKKIVIASNNFGSREIIKEGENGYLFDIGNSKKLADKIDKAIINKNRRIRENAYKYVIAFNWDNIIKKIQKIIK